MIIFDKNKHTDFQLYGRWNSLVAYNSNNDLIATIPAHDGDFFPESPLNHIAQMRKAVLSGDFWNYSFIPIRVDIDITQLCSDNCYFCYSRKYSNTAPYRRAQISKRHFETLIKELSLNGAKTIRFTGGGEPLMHPDIEKLLSIPKENGLRTCLITNGSRLSTKINRLLISNIDQIRISINAFNDNTRSLIHGYKRNNNSASELFANIRELSMMRNEIFNEEKRPLILITFLILPENISEMYDCAIETMNCGADSISFRPVYHNYAHAFSTT